MTDLRPVTVDKRGAHDDKPVSYKHLDVYKRQVLRRPGKGATSDILTVILDR